MERILPELELAGHSFVVDVAKGELRLAKDEDWVASFSNMQDEGTHYLLTLDPSITGVAAEKTVTVPRMLDLDPEGMVLAYGGDVRNNHGKTDFEVIVDQELLTKRLGGELPTIDIDGHTYYVDLRLRELRPENMLQPVIKLDHLEMNREGTAYHCMYDQRKRRPCDPQRTIAAGVKDVAILRIPYELQLDPVGVARQHGLKETELLRNFPMGKNLKATLTPLSKQNQQQEQQQSSKPQKKRSRRL